MADISSAATMVNYYTDHPPQIRGRTVYVQFSNHEQLKTEQSSQVRNVLSYSTHLCRLFSMARLSFELWEIASLAILKYHPVRKIKYVKYILKHIIGPPWQILHLSSGRWPVSLCWKHHPVMGEWDFNDLSPRNSINAPVKSNLFPWL